VIKSITWDFDNLVRLAPGSDLWPVTWAADGHLYTSWGDGGGFGGTNSDGRVSLGFARIEGPPESLVGINVWGGKNPENPATFGGKAMGMLSVDGILYAWINMQNENPPDYKLIWSDDSAATWQQSTWSFAGDTAAEFTFINFGQDYAGARDEFVYMYHLIRGGSTDSAWLIRAPKNQILDRTAYEWFAGLDGNGDPLWTADIAQRASVFQDPNFVGLTSVSYNPGIDRYLLVTAHGAWEQSIGRLGVFDAPEPWGPWTTVEYYEDWGGYTGWQNGYHIPTKTPDWMSADGKTIHLLFSGQGVLDSFNLVKGTLFIPDTFIYLPLILKS
jgi:hypothetical protein